MNISTAYRNHTYWTGATRSFQSYKSSSKASGVSYSRDTISISAKCSFASVSLCEEDVENYYGNKKITGSYSGHKTKGCTAENFADIDIDKVHQIELPDSIKDNDSGGYFYHGQNVTGNELIQLAVSEGKMTMDEVNSDPCRAKSKAFDVMIADQAKAKYSWSSTRYSEDGQYTFTTDANGKTKWHLVEDSQMGASLEEIAGWMCSGTPNRNIETRYLQYLQRMDPDLYQAATQIGKEVRNYDLLTTAYQAGFIGEAQHDYDLGLLAMLFNQKGDAQFYSQLTNAKKTGCFDELLQNYDPIAATRLDNLRGEQMKRTGGIH